MMQCAIKEFEVTILIQIFFQVLNYLLCKKLILIFFVTT